MTSDILRQPVCPKIMLECARRLGDPRAAEDQASLLTLAQALLEEDPEALVSVMIRLRALVKLMDHPLMRVWAREEIDEEKSGEVAYFSEPVIIAAADQELIGPESDLTFDPDAFFAHVLEVSEEKGHG